MIAYLTDRLRERSTWIDLVAAVGAVAAMPAPWCYIGFALGVAKSLIPDGPVKR